MSLFAFLLKNYERIFNIELHLYIYIYIYIYIFFFLFLIYVVCISGVCNKNNFPLGLLKHF